MQGAALSGMLTVLAAIAACGAGPEPAVIETPSQPRDAVSPTVRAPDGRDVVPGLDRASVRVPMFRVRAGGAAGLLPEVEPPTSTFAGVICSGPGSAAGASPTRTSKRGQARSPEGWGWCIEPAPDFSVFQSFFQAGC